MSRWYDKRPRLRKGLDGLKEINPGIRLLISKEIIDIVRQKQPDLLTFEKALSFRLDSTRLRWYEHDPHLWVLFNVLQLADVAVLELVEDFF
ncbi:MAG: hypothetical protein ACI8W0_001231 [Flavobacterium sp.]|jgi:hypothetical protein